MAHAFTGYFEIRGAYFRPVMATLTAVEVSTGLMNTAAIEGIMIGLISWIAVVTLSFPISFVLLRTIATLICEQYVMFKGKSYQIHRTTKLIWFPFQLLYA